MKIVKTKDLVIGREYYFDLLEEQKGIFEGKDNLSILFTPTYEGERTYAAIGGKVTFNKEYETTWIEVSPEKKAPAQEISDCEKENNKLKEERAVLFAACDNAKTELQQLLGLTAHNKDIRAIINMLDKAMKMTLKI